MKWDCAVSRGVQRRACTDEQITESQESGQWEEQAGAG